MTSLKCWNSGVLSNGPSLINPLSGREVSSRAPVSCVLEARSCLAFFRVTGEFFVSDATANNLFHDVGESLWHRWPCDCYNERLFVDITEQMI